jgi:hypothetical protein
MDQSLIPGPTFSSRSNAVLIFATLDLLVLFGARVFLQPSKELLFLSK